MNLMWKTKCAAVAGLILLIGSPALGQYRLGTGHALDRNLRKGSGGFNAPRRQNTAGQYQDAIITGNVGGLARFRGDIDYRAAGEFSAPLGSDMTYQFRRQSLPTVPLTQYQRRQFGGEIGSDALISPNAPRPTALIRPGSGIDAGQVTGQRLRYRGALNVRRDDPTGPVGRRYDGINTLDDYRRITPEDARLSGRAFGQETVEPGRLLEVSASPLTGLRLQRLDGRPLDPGALEGVRQQPGGSTGTMVGTEPLTADGTRRGGQVESPDPAGRAGDRPDARRDERADQRVRASSRQGRRLGRQLDSGRLTARRAGRETAEDAAEFGVSREGAFMNVKPGEDVYRDLLLRIRGEQGTGDSADGGSEQGATAGPGRGDAAEDDSSVDDIAERFRRTQAQGTDPNAGAAAAGSQRLDELDYDLPPLESMAGSGETAFNRLLARAEERMGEGRYFDAGSLYQRALSLRPGYPLAMIGQVHAQLAAGLFRSASTNLRRVLSRHPELIAARYNQPLLPETPRLREVQNELQRQAQADGGADAALLLAYLAYQRNQPAIIQDALSELGQQRENDRLLPLLRSIWLPSPDQTNGVGSASETSDRGSAPPRGATEPADRDQEEQTEQGGAPSNRPTGSAAGQPQP